MTLPRTVREVLDEHTTLEVESIDRMYLNVRRSFASTRGTCSHRRS
jgi:hypothetical protein